MIKTPVVVLCVASCFTAAATQAQSLPHRKPGLWEAQVTTGGASTTSMPNMQEQLANMPPEQRAQMEAIMKQRGMSSGAQGNALTVKFCLSEKEATDDSAKSLLSRAERDASKCEHKIVSRSPTELKIHAVCKTEKGPSEFDMRVYDVTPVSMSMEMNGKSTDRGEIRMQQKARWVGSDCGTVK